MAIHVKNFFSQFQYVVAWRRTGSYRDLSLTKSLVVWYYLEFVKVSSLT